MNRWVDEQIFPAALSLILTSCSPCSASTSLPSPEPSAPCWRAETGRTPQSPPRSRPPPGPESGSGRTAWTPSPPEPNTKETTDPRTEDVTSSCLTSGVWCDLTCCSSSSRDDASRARRLLRLLVQTFRQRGWSEDRMWREMLVWTVDTDLPGERDRIHLHQTVSPFYPCCVKQYDQNL